MPIVDDYEQMREKPSVYTGSNWPVLLLIIMLAVSIFLVSISKQNATWGDYVPYGALAVLGYLLMMRKKVDLKRIMSLPEAMEILYYDLNNKIKIQEVYKQRLPIGEILLDGTGDLIPSPWTGDPWRYFIAVTIRNEASDSRTYFLAMTSPYHDGVGLIGLRRLPGPWSGYNMDKIVVFKKPEDRI